MAIRLDQLQKRGSMITLNMIPMIDIVFMLILFFALTTRFMSSENVSVELPKPENNLAQPLKFPNRMVLTCQFIDSADPESRVVRYQLGPTVVADKRELEGQLKAIRIEEPDIQLILRADRRLEYKYIRDVMLVIARAGIANFNIATEIENR